MNKQDLDRTLSYLQQLLAISSPTGCTDDAADCSANDDIHQPIPIQAEGLYPAKGIEKRQHKAHTNNQAIPVHLNAKDLKGNPIDCKFQAQAREGYNIHHSLSHFPLSIVVPLGAR